MKMRTFRAQIESKTKTKLDMQGPFATWLIRWAGEVLTKYSKGNDGKTSWQRRRNEPCMKPIALAGEKVPYLPLKTATIHADKGEPKMFDRKWFGIKART